MFIAILLALTKVIFQLIVNKRSEFIDIVVHSQASSIISKHYFE